MYSSLSSVYLVHCASLKINCAFATACGNNQDALVEERKRHSPCMLHSVVH